MKYSQHDIILKAMLENKNKKEWKASDFQSGKYFVGYEATARMSEIAVLYFDFIEVGKDGKFRTLSVNWKNKKAIKQMKKRLGIK